MSTWRRSLGWAIPALLIVTSAAGASTRPEMEPAPSRKAVSLMPVRIDRPDVQRSLSRRPVWSNFRARYGDWKPLWNELTGTPHRAFGQPITLPGFANNAASVDQAVRGFIARNADLFGGPGVQLETISNMQIGERWVVRYRQIVQGVPVLYADWEFRVSSAGRLYLFGADAYAARTAVDLSSRIAPAVAREAAKAGLVFQPATDRVQGGDKLFLMPVQTELDETELRLVTAATVQTRKPYVSEVRYVDARSGALLSKTSLRQDAITGSVRGNVHLTSPYGGLTNSAFANETVKAQSGVTTNSANTNAAGNYSVNGPGSSNTVTTTLLGPYCEVFNANGTTASFSQGAVPATAVVSIDWTTRSTEAERDAYYHTNLAHDWLKAIDPLYTASDYPLLVNVNIIDDDCEAFWDATQNSMSFFLDGSGCPNTASLPDIVWHEYAHSTTYNMYFTVGQRPNGCENLALAEGLADAFSALLDDDGVIGNDFFGLGTSLRNLNNVYVWPQDGSPNPYNSGQILAGALWELRQSTTNTLAKTLRHFAIKIGFADDLNDGVAMSEYFIDVLDADDNDGNLGNGTPNLTAIVNAFNHHGIGTAFYISAEHTPLNDQVSSGPYPINALVQYLAPVGSFTSAKLFVSSNNSPYSQYTMLPTGNPDEYGAEIPAQSYGVVRYYLQFTDSYGGTKTVPGGAPTRETYLFLAGPGFTTLSLTMESSPGWTVGFSGDDAVTGIWERGTPYPTGVQPGTDHTAAGTQCWVTGNAATLPEDPPGIDDVDGPLIVGAPGKTTLVTNTFNALAGGYIHPMVSFWYWFTNEVGDSGAEDPWKVFISNNNGSTWKLLTNTLSSTNAWRRDAYLIEKYLTPTTTMKMRFVAQDTLNPSLVEAGLDDFLVQGYPTVDVPASEAPGSLSLAAAFPNPFEKHTHVRFSLPTAGRVELSVFDLAGRRIRTLVAGERRAGSHNVEWDGVDASGHRAPSGPYYLRLSRGDRVISQGVVLVR